MTIVDMYMDHPAGNNQKHKNKFCTVDLCLVYKKVLNGE